ncbi:MAG: hypothetical protein NTU95_00445 [Methanothrix sp.]|nr:hypothetical protein [Methanothrix sp.]
MIRHKTHLERAISVLPLPYNWAGASVGALFFLNSIIIMALLEKSFAHITSYFILSTLIAQQIIIVVWAHEKILNLRDIFIYIIELPALEVARWHESQELDIFNDRRMILTGVSTTIIAIKLGLDQLGFTSQPYYSYVFVKIYYYLAHYLMGAGLYVLIATALVVYNMGKLPLRVNVIISKNIRFKGVLYSKFTLCSASVYIAWGLFHLSTPLKLSTLPSILWFSSFAILLCAYFILPQYSIHQMMIKTKKEKLKIFSAYLRDNAEEALLNPTKENASRLKNMLDIQCQLDEMCQWPFGSYEVLHIALIIIIPLVVVILEIIFGIIK